MLGYARHPAAWERRRGVCPRWGLWDEHTNVELILERNHNLLGHSSKAYLSICVTQEHCFLRFYIKCSHVWSAREFCNVHFGVRAGDKISIVQAFNRRRYILSHFQLLLVWFLNGRFWAIFNISAIFRREKAENRVRSFSEANKVDLKINGVSAKCADYSVKFLSLEVILAEWAKDIVWGD